MNRWKGDARKPVETPEIVGVKADSADSSFGSTLSRKPKGDFKPRAKQALKSQFKENLATSPLKQSMSHNQEVGSPMDLQREGDIRKQGSALHGELLFREKPVFVPQKGEQGEPLSQEQVFDMQHIQSTILKQEAVFREQVQREGWKPDFENPSEECLLKIYGMKCLVKSFLPHKDAQLRIAKLKGLLGVMAKLLTSGEVSDDIKSSDIDRANLRLAAGKAVLRLARRWDSQISPAIVHSTLWLAHDSSIEVRQKFLVKVHQYLKERALHPKYAFVFALVAVDPIKESVTDGKRYLADFVDSSRREARSKQVSLSGQIEGTTITLHPDYVLTYLVHVLAHRSEFPSDAATANTAAYEPAYKQLLSFLRALVHQDGDGRSETGKKEDVDNLPAILAIFCTIKNAEDLLDKEKSEVS